MPELLRECRCSECRKLLLKGIIFDGTLEIKCKRCGKINSIGIAKHQDDPTHYLLIIDDKGKIIAFSSSACGSLGYAQSELIGKDFSQVNPTIPIELGKRLFGPESPLDDQGDFRLDTFHQKKDGTKIPVVASLKLYQPSSREKCILVYVESKNSANEAKFARDGTEFSKNICDFRLAIDKNGIVEYVSPSMEKLFGFSPEMIVGKYYFDFLPAETKEEFIKIFKHFSSAAQPYKMTHHIGRNSHDRTTCCDLYFTPRFDCGNFTGYCVLGWEAKKPEHKKKKA